MIANLVVNADQAMPRRNAARQLAITFLAPQTGRAADLRRAITFGSECAMKASGSPELLKQIFDPYFTTKPKGNGLGLATTYSIIKNHNGLITVESELHCGSTFTVYLPRPAASAAIVPPATRPAERSPPLQGSAAS